MQHTMRSAYRRWMILHEECLWKTRGHVKVPAWFRWHIRKNYDWNYYITDFKYRNYYKNNGGNPRRFKGHYLFQITDDDLINLQKPKWELR